MTTPPDSCRIAFKEWAAVCAALAAGKQTIILRKGGIAEGPGGFQAEHSQFWLYPTNFHQGAEALTPVGADFLAAIQAQRPPAGTIRLQHLAVVEEVQELSSENAALALRGLHVWSDETVRQRFHYRRPGLYLLIVRMYATSMPRVLDESPEFAGCKTWVEFPESLPVGQPHPVLDDAAYADAAAQIRNALRSA
jgi:hypothetical protein